jgi:hypothetical protein
MEHFLMSQTGGIETYQVLLLEVVIVWFLLLCALWWPGRTNRISTNYSFLYDLLLLFSTCTKTKHTTQQWIRTNTSSTISSKSSSEVVQFDELHSPPYEMPSCESDCPDFCNSPQLGFSHGEQSSRGDLEPGLQMCLETLNGISPLT